MRLRMRGTPSADYDSDHDCCGRVSETECLDIVTRFGRRYIIEYEDNHFQGSRCPWHRQIVCARGHGFIAPSGGQELYAYAQGAAVVKQLAGLCKADDNFTVKQETTQEIGITFDIEHFAPVAAILQPQRR